MCPKAPRTQASTSAYSVVDNVGHEWVVDSFGEPLH